jgi:demethylmenaquinone methyltransferase/2-methoxy-6-polyprenyl-1,4-benzoquinol methylase
MPIQQKAYDLYAGMIAPGERVLDIATGTGGLAFTLAAKASYVAGIDISKKNIASARRLKERLGTENVEFIRGDASRTSEFVDGKFDVAVISMALHEMPPGLRRPVIDEAVKLADRIILADYASPMPRNIFGMFNYAVEYIAGREHYRGFRHFVDNGGLDALVAEKDLRIIQNKKINKGNMQLILAEK